MKNGWLKEDFVDVCMMELARSTVVSRMHPQKFTGCNTDGFADGAQILGGCLAIASVDDSQMSPGLNMGICTDGVRMHTCGFCIFHRERR